MKTLKFLPLLFCFICCFQINAQSKKKQIDIDFISEDAEIIFVDDFNNEKVEEFPSRWLHESGNIQTNQVKRMGKNEGVIEFVSGGIILPNVEGDYLSESFKLELQCYFYLKGNESYSLTLFDRSNRKHKNSVTIRSSGLHHASTGLARIAGAPVAGWRTVQLSFNKGNLKIYYQGRRLVNVPNVGFETCTHLSFAAASPGGTKGDYDRLALLNYLKIAKEGLPLYDQFSASGELVIRNITFDSNSHKIKPSSHTILDKIVKMLEDHPEVSLTIQGHTDAQGSRESNQLLSEKRAAAVLDYLVTRGIIATRLKSEGHGEDKPEDPGDTSEAWSMNRRVVLYRR